MTLNRWRKRGSLEGAPAELRDFCYRLNIAEANGANALLRVISKAGAKRDWKAAAWILERRFPDEWGRREPTSAKDNPVQDEPLSDEGRERTIASFIAVCERTGSLARYGYVKATVLKDNGTSDVATV